MIMATSRWMILTMVTAVLMGSGAVAEAQKGDGLEVGGKGAAAQRLLSIAGKVVDSTGQPLKGVEIEVTIEGISKTFDVKTKKKGKFNLRVPFKDAQYLAHARLDGYRQVNTTVATAQDGNLLVEITMEEDSGPVEGPVPVGEKAEAEPELTEEQVTAVTAYNEGVRAMQVDDKATAVAKFAEAAAIDPELNEALSALAALAFEAKDYETLADATEKLLRLQPDDLRVLQMAYVANYMTGDAEGLASAARRLAELDPQMVERDMIRNANSGFESGNTDLCRALMEVAVEARPDL
ncbi:MAG: carboxypeptidase-like regulatory domain-containing protein, partial [Deltaproteobacteria bacterium]